MISDVANMDCMEYMAQFPDKFFDLAVVDPPYGINMDGGKIGGGKEAKVTEYTKKDWDKTQNKWLWEITPEAQQWLCSSEDITFMAKQCMTPVFKDRKVTFVNVEK